MTARLKDRKPTSRKNRRMYADNLWAKLIKKMYGGVCFVCQQTPVEAAHIIGRAHYSVRHHPQNGIALCHTHHRAFDTYATDRDVLIRAAIGKQAYEELKLAAQKKWDKDYDGEIARIKSATLNLEDDDDTGERGTRKVMGRLGGVCKRGRAYRADLARKRVATG